MQHMPVLFLNLTRYLSSFSYYMEGVTTSRITQPRSVIVQIPGTIKAVFQSEEAAQVFASSSPSAFANCSSQNRSDPLLNSGQNEDIPCHVWEITEVINFTSHNRRAEDTVRRLGDKKSQAIKRRAHISKLCTNSTRLPSCLPAKQLQNGAFSSFSAISVPINRDCVRQH